MLNTRVDNDLLNYHHKFEDKPQAEQAAGAKASFLNSMSHDIRTPMNAIIGYTTLAQIHYKEPDKVKDYLEKIATSSNYLLSLINDVLEMSRIESGKLRIENAPCNLREVMKEIETVMIGQIQDKNLSFHMDIDIQNEKVMCDRLRLNQILINVLGNAVKFTPDGGSVYLKLSQNKNCPKEGYAGYCFRIKDTGIGMSEEFLEHIFEEFSRENDTTKSGIPGTGLGMAITKSIVDMMEGEITAKSKLREGTEFIIDLNFMLEDKDENKAPDDNPESDSKHNVQLIKRLLLAEDNAINQEIATEILTEYGYVIELANNGSEAYEMVKNSTPGYYQAVLMDVQMPVMNGYEATWRIRSLAEKSLADIPIIAMTANAFDEDRKMALMAGMNDFVSKPFDVKLLLEALARLEDTDKLVSAV